MAKPLSTCNVPAFCLSCFGTDNKFTTEEIVLRWKYILDECQQRGITVLTISSDGDTRLLTGMRMCSGLNVTNVSKLHVYLMSYQNQRFCLIGILGSP